VPFRITPLTEDEVERLLDLRSFCIERNQQTLRRQRIERMARRHPEWNPLRRCDPGAVPIGVQALAGQLGRAFVFPMPQQPGEEHRNWYHLERRMQTPELPQLQVAERRDDIEEPLGDKGGCHVGRLAVLFDGQDRGWYCWHHDAAELHAARRSGRCRVAMSQYRAYGMMAAPILQSP